MNILMSKPSKPEELYKFFTYGMPLDYTNIQYIDYCNCIRKKGWNIITSADKDNLWLEVAYYTNWNRSETWYLAVCKYVKYDKQN